MPTPIAVRQPFKKAFGFGVLVERGGKVCWHLQLARFGVEFKFDLDFLTGSDPGAAIPSWSGIPPRGWPGRVISVGTRGTDGPGRPPSVSPVHSPARRYCSIRSGGKGGAAITSSVMVGSLRCNTIVELST